MRRLLLAMAVLACVLLWLPMVAGADVAPALTPQTDPALVAALSGRVNAAALDRSVPTWPLNPKVSGLPPSGDVRILVVPICFKDCRPSKNTDTLFAQFFGNPTTGFPFDSLAGYYRRSSYSTLRITGDVQPWYGEPVTRSSIKSTRAAVAGLIQKALRTADSRGVDFSRYDANGDGRVDNIVFVWTGPVGKRGSIWWSFNANFPGFAGQQLTLDGKSIGNFTWVWEKGTTSMVRTVCHETGHALGLPDYYDTDKAKGPSGGVGGLDVMDDNIGDHNCFSKLLLGWAEPQFVHLGEDRTVTLRSSSATPDALVVFPRTSGDSPFSEFFMVQNRTRTSNDDDPKTPGEGLLIWHVDATLNSAGNGFAYNNGSTSHKLLRLIEADGLEEIDQGRPANAGDYFLAGDTIGPETQPNLQLYDGSASDLNISCESVAGTRYAVRVSVADHNDGPARVRWYETSSDAERLAVERLLEQAAPEYDVTSAQAARVSELPQSAGGYAAFTDVLILGDLRFSSIGDAQQQAVADWVRGGGSLVVTGGDADMSSGKIADVLPVDFTGDSWGQISAQVNAPPWFRSVVNWSGCPGWSGFKKSRLQGDTSSTVVALSAVSANGSSSYPLVVSSRLGAGRIVVFTSDLTPKWGTSVVARWSSAGAFYASLVDAAR